MITASPVLFSLLQSQSAAWVTTSGPLALFGIYYGFLTTLPFGFSQLVSLRACLLEEQDKRPSHWPKLSLFGETIPDALLWSLSGLMVAQVALFASAYCPPLYAIWVRPHALSLFLFPYAWIYLSRIARFERLFRPDTRIWYEQLGTAFLDSFVFQVLNPVLLPSPVLARLMSLFLFRYSQMPLFVLGGVVGWLAGHATFALLSYLLLLRLQYDAPYIYRVTQRLVHEPFPRIVLAFCLALLARAPVPLLTSHLQNTPESSLQQHDEKSVLKLPKRWPDTWFDHHLWKRPTRSLREYIAVDPKDKDSKNKKKRSLQTHPWYKKHFSQHFFEAVMSDGKRRLSYTYPQGLVTLQRPLEHLLGTQELSQETETNLYDTWASTHARHFDELIQSVSRRMEALDQGAEIEQVIEKRLSSWTEEEEIVGKLEDPRLAQSLRGRTLFTGSNWILFEKEEDFVDNMLNHHPTPTKNALTNWVLDRDATMHPAGDTLSVGEKTLTEILQSELQQNTLGFADVPMGAKGSLAPDYVLKEIPLWTSDAKMIDIDPRRPHPTKETRKSARSSFKRDLFKGSMRGRLRKAMVCNLIQRRFHAPFWLRVRQPEIEETISETENWDIPTVEVREAWRTRRLQWYDNLFIHIMRGPTLLIQLYLRRFVRQPLFIILKTLGRLLLFQPLEWSQDWSQWRQETHVYCAYSDQKSSTALPDRWLALGLQIKILSPFRLRPWHRSSLPISAPISLPKSSYLDVLGQERLLPLGDIKVLPSFWRPVIKAIPLWLQQPSSSPWGLWRRGLYFLLQKLLKLQSFGNKQRLTSGVEISIKSPEVVATSKSVSVNSLEQALPNTQKQQLTTREQEQILTKGLTKEIEKQNAPVITEHVQIEVKSAEARQKLIELHSWMSRLHTTPSFETGSALKVKPRSTTRVEYLPTEVLWKQRWRIQVHSKVSHFQLRSLSDESRRSVQYRKNQLKEALLYTRRQQTVLNRQIRELASHNWFHARRPQTLVKRELSNGSKPFSRWVKTQKQWLYLSGPQLIQKPVRLVEQQIRRIDLSLKPLWQMLLFKRWKSSFVEQNEPKDTLSQAYILHKVWEAKTRKQPGVTQFLPSEGVLRSSFEQSLRVQDVLNLSNPQALGLSTWHEWLDSLYHHMPPVPIWRSLAPQHWTLQRPPSLNVIPEAKEGFQPVNISPLLDPLFTEAKHASLRLRFFALSYGYTNLFSLEGLPSKPEEPLLNGYSTKLGSATSGRSTLAILAKETDRSIKKLKKLRCWQLIDNFDTASIYRQRNLERGHVSIEAAAIASNLAEETLLWKDVVNRRREHLLKVDLKQIRKRRLEMIEQKESLYTTRRGPLRFNLVEDTSLLENIAGMLLRFMRKQQAKTADLSIDSGNTSFSEDAPYNSIWCTTPLTPEETLLPAQVQTLRVLDNLELTASLKDYQNLRESSQLPHADVLLNGEEQSASMDNVEMAQEERESHVIKRFLWPSHRLEDLACMNRFWLGTANQSRLSALRLRMYPSIPST